MTQRKQEDSAVDQIIQLAYPLSADEHDHLVDEIQAPLEHASRAEGAVG